MKLVARNKPRFTLAEAGEVAERLYGFGGELVALDSERDQNFKVFDPAGVPYVLKIANQAELVGVMDLQIQALAYLHQQDPTLPIPRTVPTPEGEAYTTINHKSGAAHIVRAVTYLPGQVLSSVPVSALMSENIGRFLARLDKALSGFFTRMPIMNSCGT